MYNSPLSGGFEKGLRTGWRMIFAETRGGAGKKGCWRQTRCEPRTTPVGVSEEGGWLLGAILLLSSLPFFFFPLCSLVHEMLGRLRMGFVFGFARSNQGEAASAFPCADPISMGT